MSAKEARTAVEAKEPFSPDGLYPEDHEFGMKVPEGGSACSKCEYLDKETMRDCEEQHFIRWNGGTRIKGKITAYCCDDFKEAGEEERPLTQNDANKMSPDEVWDSKRPVFGRTVKE